ncbi:MAG: hypothetical protein V5A68_08120, partial [Candidatus Thermoplasmatota archaeon]
YGEEEKIKGMKDYKRTYELSQPKKIDEEMPLQLSYRHLATLVQIEEKWNNLKKILLRTEQIPENIKKEDEKRIRRRAEHANFWIQKYAPKQILFKVKKELPKINLSKKQKDFLQNLKKEFESKKWNGENIHQAIYDAVEKTEIKPGLGFKTIYQIILNKNKGPRAGYFLSNLEKEFVINRISKAI